jgi:hypothetical protein
VSGHLHTVVGASAFSQTFDASAWDNAECSTTEIQDNHSNYWQPSMMARLANGSFEAVPLSEVRIYYLCNVSVILPGGDIKCEKGPKLT